ncbi:PEP-CTERM sorting domain-containing protein [Rubripirellula lacrimiformis]|nr:PEP-CTERM sorting domain-containing protein [Rubripirellula lacrimiformis]
MNYSSGGGGFTIAPTNVDPSITGDALTAERGLRSLGLTNSYGFGDWDPTSNSFDDAVAVFDFWTWGFSVNSGENVVNLEGMDIRLVRNFSGPDAFEIQASVNGGAALALFSHDFGGEPNPVNFFGIDLGGLGTLTPGDRVDFTLAAFNSTSTSGNFGLVNFNNGSPGLVVNGSVTAVPEPSMIAVLSLLSTGGLIVRRYRKKV